MLAAPAAASASPPEAPRLRWPASRRLRERAEFDRVLRSGGALRGSLLQVNFAANGLPYPRLGLIVARRQLPSSVDRNHCRRIVRETVRNAQRALGGIDLVVRLRRGYDRKSRPALAAEIRELISRVKA